VVAGVVLGFAVGVFGISFGLIAVTSGLSPAKACAMSLLIFTGASQFAAVGVVASGGSPASAVASALFLAARNGVYGLAMSPILSGGLPRRLVAAQLVIDESTAMATAQPDRVTQEKAFWASGLAVFVFWNVGTLVGALGGRLIGDPRVWGLDAAFPAAFVALLGPHLRTVGGRRTALLGGAIVLVLSPLLPPGVPIVIAATASLVGLSRAYSPT
jgi:4-azaleucine resistance transporter AzlC